MKHGLVLWVIWLIHLNNFRHKACHAFKEESNAEFRPTFHPRFGLIIGLYSKRQLQQNEEILIDYQYSSIKTSPLWYQQAWKRYLKETRKWTDDLISKHGNAAHDVTDIFLRTEQKFLWCDKKDVQILWFFVLYITKKHGSNITWKKYWSITYPFVTDWLGENRIIKSNVNRCKRMNMPFS